MLMTAAKEISDDTDLHPAPGDPPGGTAPAMQNWTEAFHFSDDLRALEDFYYEQHQEALEAEARTYHPVERQEAPSKAETGEDVSPEDAMFLKRLSEQISQRLGDHLSRPEVMAQYLRLNELERDNHVMAQQIQALKHALHGKEIELQAHMEQAAQYKKLFGNLYYKTAL